MSILEILEAKRRELDLTKEPPGKETKLDRDRGTTKRMRNYCRNQGLANVPDQNIIWFKNNGSYKYYPNGRKV